MTSRALQGLLFACSLAFGTICITSTSIQVSAQETTGGIQGTVHDPSGAVVPGAKVDISGASLIGSKEVLTDRAGFYRFVNLPPGTYALTARASGFDAVRLPSLIIEVGHFPTVDVSMKVGSAATTVEVSAESTQIEQTTSHGLTNIDATEIAELPHGTSFQSLIPLSPAARNEPLQGDGPQINGGANAENSYLIEGQETANIKYGTSNADVPIDFIQEMQIKTSGIESEYQGSMSGTVNVIMKKGSNDWHGNLFVYYDADILDAGPKAMLRQDPLSTGVAQDLENNFNGFDPSAQVYQGVKDHYRKVQPGGTVGGPIWRDKIWAFVGFAPYYQSLRRTIDFGGSVGTQSFPQDDDRYFFSSRIDAAVSSKVRVFGSWLNEYHRAVGTVLPYADSAQGLFNSSAPSGPSSFPSGIGYSAPNQNLNVGADITITKSLVATSRFGHFFDNYGDRGWPSGDVYIWGTSGLSGTALDGSSIAATPLAESTGTQTAALSSIYAHDADKHDQFAQDMEWFKSTGFGTHEIKFGYSLNHLFNNVQQQYSGPYVRLFPNSSRTFAGSTGASNCAAIEAYNQAHYGTPGGTASACRGNFGYMRTRDYQTLGSASSWNHGIYVQDAWTLKRTLTINAGIRLDKEYLPAYPQSVGFSGNPIDFGWGDKLGPRVGAAWNVFGKDKLKIFGSYGKFYDQMKLNLAIGSFGGQFWHDCFYALYTTDYTSLQPAYTNGHYCTGSGDANFAGGTVPAGLTFIENIDFRSSEGVDPDLKPYSQHESTFGFEYQIAPQWVARARWDRRRLDHVIEDAGVLDAFGNENFAIVNPGEGIDKLVPGCDTCPVNVRAARNYDGFELQLDKNFSHGFMTNISYTYSKLRGNYSGLTNTDLSDGGGGRENPNNNRAFDEPYFEFTANGTASNGLLATDRPNVLKIGGYYQLHYLHGQTSSFGLFQQAYSGTPLSTYMDIEEAGGYPVYVEGRGKWVPVSTDSNGFAVFGTPTEKRTPAYTQTDVNYRQIFRTGSNDRRTVTVEADVTNLLNQRNVVEYYSQMNSGYQGGAVQPAATVDYSVLEQPYDYKTLFNDQGVQLNSQYGQPLNWQSTRSMRLKVSYTF